MIIPVWNMEKHTTFMIANIYLLELTENLKHGKYYILKQTDTKYLTF